MSGAPNFDLSNQQAETLLLAAFLKYPDAYWSLNDCNIGPEDFLGNENRRVMKAVQSVTAEKRLPDLPNVIEELKASDYTTTIEYLNRLVVLPVSVAQAKDYANTVKGLSMNRQLALAGSQIASIAAENRADAETAMAEAESILRKVRMTLPQPDRSPDPGDILRRLKAEGPEPIAVLRFSPSLQDLTGGLFPGWLWVIGGFSSVGKSAVACNMVLDVLAEPDRWAMLVSTEMTQEQYLMRLLSLHSRVPMRAIRDRVVLPFDNMEPLKKAEQRIGRANLRIFDTVYRTADIRSQATRMKETTGLDVLFVDFLQNVRGDIGDFSYADATSTIIDLQNLAKDLHINVIAFSQISNEMAKYEGSDFYAYKGSGAIKDAADVAIMLKRDRKSMSPVLDIHVEKNRHGELKVIPTTIDLPTGRITEEWATEEEVGARDQ